MAIKKAIITCIISLAVISYLPIFQCIILSREKVRIEDISHYEKRFEAVKSTLPAHGVIGYLSDCSDMHNAKCIEGFYIAQYALSPLVLERSSELPLLLANFHNDDIILSKSKRLLYSGNGIELYLMDKK
jgi:hypothetical protein